MTYDLVIRGGTLVDGTGSPGRQADVAVNGDRIVAIGDLAGKGREEIDATGLVVAPGFVDVHTHYDAQVFWDPRLTPSCFHGVTSVIAGNCGFSIAPLNAEAAPYLTRMLAKVEGMPVAALRQGVPWNWSSFADYLARLEGRVGLNIGVMAGHSAIRRVVMGERAVGSEATPAELAQMKDVLAESLAAGALGFSTTLALTHCDAEGQPVPSRHASRDEVIALSGVCREFEGTSLEVIPNVGRFGEPEYRLMTDMSLAAQRAVNWNALVPSDTPGQTVSQLEASDYAARHGAEVVALTVPQPMSMRINLFTGFIFEALGGFAQLFRMPVDERIEWLRHPENRAELDRRGTSSESGIFQFVAKWDQLVISTSGDQSLIGRRVGDIARERGVTPIDAMIDIAIADGLKTSFLVEGSGADDATWQVRGQLWQDPRTVIGASDAGAHLDMIDQFAFSTAVLSEGVRVRKLIGLEQAVHQLTQVPAELVGLRERGVVREGWFADLVVFDPATVGIGPLEMRHDLPAGEMRLYADAIGVPHVIVNGRRIVVEGEHTGDLAGKVLRSGKDTATRPIPMAMAAE